MCHSSSRDVPEASNSSTCRRWGSEISRAPDFPDAKLIASPARSSGALTPMICELGCREQLQDAHLLLHAESSLIAAIRSARWRVSEFSSNVLFSVRFSSLPRLFRGVPRRRSSFGLEGLPEDFVVVFSVSRFHYYMSWLVALDNLTADTLQTKFTLSCTAEAGVLEACSCCASEVSADFIADHSLEALHFGDCRGLLVFIVGENLEASSLCAGGGGCSLLPHRINRKSVHFVRVKGASCSHCR